MSESAVPQHPRPLHRGQAAICWQGGGVGGVGAAKNRGRNVRDWARNCRGLGIIFVIFVALNVSGGNLPRSLVFCSGLKRG